MWNGFSLQCEPVRIFFWEQKRDEESRLRKVAKEIDFIQIASNDVKKLFFAMKISTRPNFDTN